MKPDECEGCNLYDSMNGVCLDLLIERVKYCPFATCLGKMRCGCACKDWRDARSSRELK